MANVSRRVSYILPSPAEQPPILSLPPFGHSRRGHTSPALVRADASQVEETKNPFLDTPSPTPLATQSSESMKPKHPRHCLGISSLALDSSTLLSGTSAPGGILYTGGRDGLVASWELHVPHKRRRGGRYEGLPGRGGGRVKWERIGDGAEFFNDDEDDEDGEVEEEAGWSSDEDDVGRGEVAYESRWEVDRESLGRGKPPPTTFRQSAQTHTDWVNAMILCNLNQTVITGSSDRTIRAWSPHASAESGNLSPILVGRHRDYVRSLAWAKQPSLLFSGALDRQISIWDINVASPETPVLSIDLNKTDEYGGFGMEGDRGSVYALGVGKSSVYGTEPQLRWEDPAGTVLAAGTPANVVRLWDPRAGDKSIGKLIGHSDCVRSILVSEDGRYMLTGSSDTTIKLWSLAAHRCIHTFNHHDASVWSLYSNHPNLERFYSGSRDGLLCVVDVEQCTDMSDGECLVLAREGDLPKNGEYMSKSGDEGIRDIAAMDDEYVWTATGSADIRRWKDVGRRTNRLEAHEDGDAYASGQRDSIDGDIAIQVPSGLQGSVPIEGIRNRRLSIDGIENPLLRTDSRDSRTVAFAPTPSPRNGPIDGTGAVKPSPGVNGSPSMLASNTRDRLQPSGMRNVSASSASLANSVTSDTSMAHAANSTPKSAKLNGLPYESLVCLGLPDSPYALGFDARSEEAHTLPSGASAHSVPNSHLRAADDRRGSVGLDRDHSHDQVHRAKVDFEDRELASEAKPLRRTPDDIIAGRPGLVRSLILNDRQHVLTVDTEGEVAVWNIIRGVCVGRFSPDEVAAALYLERGVKAETAVRKHSNESLELVRDRIEGETMVITWCQVDTKIGSLVISLEEGRVFDAEVYVDDLDVEGIEGVKEDTRVNLGKWVLANLFRGLIKAEEREVTSMTPSSTTSAQPSISRSPAPSYIPIERPQIAPPHRQRAMSGSLAGAASPSLNIPGLATHALTPAILPHGDTPYLSRSAPTASSGWQTFNALKNGQLSAIPQSPATVSPVDRGQPDYFSLQRQEPSPSRADEDKRLPPQTPGGMLSPSVPQTPGGTLSKLGKLKGFGKKKTAETPMTVVPETPREEPEDKGPKFTEREKAQLHILDTVRAHPFHPPPPWEAPPVGLPPSTALLISEESKDAGAWVVTYRSQVSSTEADMEPLEMNSPMWLLDYLFTSRTRIKDPVKLTFILEPATGSGLKEMPEGTTRLSASRVLRVRKIMHFIFDKLDMGPMRNRSGSVVSMNSRSANPAQPASPGAPHSPVSPNGEHVNFDAPPEDIIELLCGDNVVDPRITLATLKQYYGSGGDVLLHYRLKSGVSFA